MEEDKKLKKKKITIIFSILFMVIILLGSTYAFFTYSKSVSAFTLTSNRIKAEFVEGTNSINITNAYPISDEFALANLDKLSYLDFTVSSEISNEDQAVTYEIYLTEDTNNTTGYSLYPGTLLASYFQLLIKHGSTDFVHRNSGSQCSQHQQCVKQYRNNIPHNRHRTKCLLENIRQSDKNE